MKFAAKSSPVQFGSVNPTHPIRTLNLVLIFVALVSISHCSFHCMILFSVLSLKMASFCLFSVFMVYVFPCIFLIVWSSLFLFDTVHARPLTAVEPDPSLPPYTIRWNNTLYSLPSAAAQLENRPPGTLLLNMLVKNEEHHLERTLPDWARIADCWIVGVDDANTDRSPQVIRKHLGHLPGEIVTVHFDGMGPTWSQLVNVGIDKYPQCTHGIIADADYRPMKKTFDKMELDVRCSKHLFTIWTEDHKNQRRMDWIYRNVPGAIVRRRTHQVLEVPELPEQEVFQTMTSLEVDEQTGGYGDRSGQKNEKYIHWLELDLIDYPGDPRTLYYLAYAHYDIYNNAWPNIGQKEQEHLEKAIELFKQRAALLQGNEEERWFTLLKLGEIHDRFLNDWDTAKAYYEHCIELDEERADPWFYVGQWYRLRGRYEEALPWLERAASLPNIDRALFHWHYLYWCLTKVEFARAVEGHPEPPLKSLKLARRLLARADCDDSDSAVRSDQLRLISVLKSKMPAKSSKKPSKLKPLRKLLSFLTSERLDYIESQLVGQKDSVLDFSAFSKLLDVLDDMELLMKNSVSNTHFTCKQYRRATTDYLRFMNKYEQQIAQHVSDTELKNSWIKLTDAVRMICR